MRKSCSDTEPHNVSIEYVQIFKSKEEVIPLVTRWVFWHECRLLRLLLICASIQQGGKAQIFKHEEQSYDVAVGFKSMIIGCFITSPFSFSQELPFKVCLQTGHLYPQQSKNITQTQVSSSYEAFLQREGQDGLSFEDWSGFGSISE